LEKILDSVPAYVYVKDTDLKFLRINTAFEDITGKKAKDILGWEPKTTLEELCAMMVEADLRRNEAGFSF